jgi:hypothetical protein
MIVTFDAELWIWDARRGDSWTFVSLPVDVAAEIRDIAGVSRRGFGSVRVHASIGGTRWATSIFPDGQRDTFVLPVKKAVRRAEGVEAGDVATVTIELVDV